MDLNFIEENYSRFEEWTRRLELLLVDLIDPDLRKQIKIEKRTKTLASCRDKYARKLADGKSTDYQLLDVCGIRIICQDKQTVDQLVELIESEFSIDSVNSVDKSNEMQTNQVGYISKHLVVSLSWDRQQLTEWAKFEQMVAEIQVRTELQHAWSAIDHRLRYKTAIPLSPMLERRLYRLAGLLEIADDEFQAILDAHSDEVANAVPRDFLLTEDNIPFFVGILPEVVELEHALIQAGGSPNEFDQSYWHERPQAASELITACNYLGIRTVDELSEFIAECALDMVNIHDFALMLFDHSFRGSIPHWIEVCIMYRMRDDISADMLEELDYTSEFIQKFLSWRELKPT